MLILADDGDMVMLDTTEFCKQSISLNRSCSYHQEQFLIIHLHDVFKFQIF